VSKRPNLRLALGDARQTILHQRFGGEFAPRKPQRQGRGIQ
jgi:hypothetical protein